jgi:hypothetical protein
LTYFPIEFLQEEEIHQLQKHTIEDLTHSQLNLQLFRRHKRIGKNYLSVLDMADKDNRQSNWKLRRSVPY